MSPTAPTTTSPSAAASASASTRRRWSAAAGSAPASTRSPPRLLTIDMTFKPANYFIYGPIPDVCNVDCYPSASAPT